MVIPVRIIWMSAVLGAVLAAGILTLVATGAPRSVWATSSVAAGGLGLLLGVATLWSRRAGRSSAAEPDLLEELDENRIQVLVRGTSLHLRDMRYRYSVRRDRHAVHDRRPFTEVINSVRLGFLPVVMTDNGTDQQGYGYVAFVYDGRRWRGPGLPCPDGREDAMNHAARCVSPLQQDGAEDGRQS